MNMNEKKFLLEELKKLYKTNEEFGPGKLIEYKLNVMIKNLEKHIHEKESKPLALHDKVKIIKADDMDQIDYIGKEGWVVKIDNSWEYPYEIQFDDNSFLNEWLWKREQLKLI